jgi:creatinine amidohydrolase
MELSKLTWPEAAGVMGPSTVALIPIGCTEPHGPHLPLDTDVTIALAQARRAADLLARDGVQALVLPPIGYGVTNFTDGFAGRVTIQPATLWSLLDDLVLALEQQDVRQVVFSNGHLEPAHVEVLRGVALDHDARGPFKAQVLFPDNTRRRWAETLGDAFRRGDHAGRYETSLILAADPAAVRDEVRAVLEPASIDLVAAIRGGAQHFRDIGADRAYCGDPRAATAAEGEATLELLAQMIVVSARETWPDLFPESAP